MKKVLVGIMMMVLMATMIIPAFGEPMAILEEIDLVEDTMEEDDIDWSEIVVENGNEIKRTYMKNGEIIDEYDIDNYSYTITYGKFPFTHIKVVKHSKILWTLGKGASWVGDKCSNGFNWVKGLFARDEK